MTPNAIEILIHCHVSQAPHPRRNALAVDEEFQSMITNGLIEPNPHAPGCFRTTKRGRAHIEQLCGMAWPVQAWVGSDGKIIDIS